MSAIFSSRVMRAPRPLGRFSRLLSTGALVLALTGCQTAYYAAWEKLGYEKRDILTSRVEDARDAQTEAKEEVVGALESFSKAVNYEGGELETQYKRFSAKLDDSEVAAANVRDRVSKVEETASALFDEWRRELVSYNNQELRAVSERQLGETKNRYNTMIAAMRTARDRLEPALRPLRDQVLFMKHNLNASALASLKGEIKVVNAEVDRLIADINKAVEQADGFIDQLR